MALKVELPSEFEEEVKKSLYIIYKQVMEDAQRDFAIKKQFLSIDEASSYIGVSKSTLEKYITIGLPIYRVEGVGKKFIKRNELEQFIEQYRM